MKLPQMISAAAFCLNEAKVEGGRILALEQDTLYNTNYESWGGEILASRRLSPGEALPRMKEILAKGESFRLVVTGVSMLPFLRDQRDAVIVAPVTEPPKRGDILFYLRAAQVCVLHRVERVCADGTLMMCGDAQVHLEPIRQSQVLARVSHIERDGKRINCCSCSWRLRSAVWQCLRPIRPYLLAVLRKTKRI